VMGAPPAGLMPLGSFAATSHDAGSTPPDSTDLEDTPAARAVRRSAHLLQ
jgi:hypothetical protein